HRALHSFPTRRSSDLNHTHKRWASGAGVAAGFVWQAPANIRAGFDWQSTRFVAGAKGTAHQVSASGQWNLRKNDSVRLQFKRERSEERRVGKAWRVAR